MKTTVNNIQEFLNKAGLNLTAHKVSDFLITVVDNDRNGMFKVWLDDNKQLIKTIWIEPAATQEDGKRFIKAMNAILISKDVELKVWQDGNTYTEFKSFEKLTSWLENLTHSTQLVEEQDNQEEESNNEQDNNNMEKETIKYEEEYNLLNEYIEELRSNKDVEGVEVFIDSQVKYLEKFKEEVCNNYRYIQDYGMPLDTFLSRLNRTVMEEVKIEIDSIKERLEKKLEETNPIEYRKIKEEQEEMEKTAEFFEELLAEFKEESKGYDKNERASRVIKIVTGKDVDAAEMTFGDFLDMMEEKEVEEVEEVAHTLEAQLERVKIAFIKEQNKKAIERLTKEAEEFEATSKWYDDQATVERRLKNNRGAQQCRKRSAHYKDRARDNQDKINSLNDLVETDEIVF